MVEVPTSPKGGSYDESGDQSPRSNVREQDRFLPIANISWIMKKALPANGKIAKDAEKTVQKCVSEFISFITGEASDKCRREKRKTINGDDLLWAMATLGFEDYIDPLKIYLARYREMEGDTKGSAKGGESSAKKNVQPSPNAQIAHQGSFSQGVNYATSQSCWFTMTVEDQRGGVVSKDVSHYDKFPVGMHVLAVDDDPICLKLLETLLRKCQYQVTTANQAVIALEMLRENRDKFDLVISDVNMPDMDGFKLLELVGLEMDLPVIMLSAHSDTKLVMKGIAHGAVDYLLKPVRIEELKNIWRHVIQRKKIDPQDQNKSPNEDKARHGNSESGQGASSLGNADQNAKNSRKWKDQNEDEEEEGDENGNDSEDPSSQKKPLGVWSVELHIKFVAAVNQLGLEKAVPKKILGLMDVEGLTRENVASHLQKYGLYLKRISRVATQQSIMVAALGEIPQSSSLQSLQLERKKSTETELAKELDLMELTADEGMDRESQACKEQEMGNAAYTKNDFDTAIAHYTKVMELDDGNISCLMNRAVAYLAIGQYDECIKDCDEVVERGRQLKSDSKMIAITLSRKGTALVKMAKHSKDYEPAIEAFQKALSEHCIPGTLKKLNDAEQAKRELEQQEYFDTKLADEEHEKGRSEGQTKLDPQGVWLDDRAVEMNQMTSNSSVEMKFEIKEIGYEASQKQPEFIQDEEMEQAISTLKPLEVVFDVDALKMPKSSGQMEFQIKDNEMEPETDRPEESRQFLMKGGLGLTEPPKDEDWENAKVMNLMDNELSVLPENPRCPKLSALFLKRNYKLRMIPPTFFDYMPALEILNLSRTGIKSLPESIIRLFSLKRLFLNDCHRFMRLSPTVGELKQLEVLDIEGTEIMDLPHEIKKLTNLTCFEVSFYGYKSDGRKAMQSSAMVPCGVISALSNLEELNIDVNPDAEQWDACVEAIVAEVCSLKNLNMLKFYFPRMELLSHIQCKIPALFYFRFIVGHHVKRILSRVPRDVEFELERWERCLKYINGMSVPRDIRKVLQHATAFFLDRHATVKKLSDFGIQNMEKLKCLVVGECNKLQVIIDEADGYKEDDSNENVSESYGTEKFVLGSLEYLYIYYMRSLRSIWDGSVQQNSLSLLKSLTLCTCPKLTTIFTQGLLNNLCKLEELNVEDCASINSIVCFDISVEHKTTYFLPNLKKISLHDMPGLVSIFGGLRIAPKLEWLSFYKCPNLKNPLIDEVSTQNLKRIKGLKSWWDALEWINGRPGYLDKIFVPINIWDC